MCEFALSIGPCPKPLVKRPTVRVHVTQLQPASIPFSGNSSSHAIASLPLRLGVICSTVVKTGSAVTPAILF